MNTSSKWVLLSFAMGTGWGREVQKPALGLPGRSKEAWPGVDTWPLDSSLVLSVLPPGHGDMAPAFRDHFANVLSAAPLASVGKAACLLLAMPGKAWEAVVWPLSDWGGSGETSWLAAGKPWQALLVLELGGAGRRPSGWWVGRCGPAAAVG